MRPFVARLVLAAIFAAVWVIALLGRMRPRRTFTPTGRIAVVGTFNNPGWFLSHIRPLAASGREVIVLTDRDQPAVAGARVVIPPRWARRLLGQAMSRLVWLAVVAVRSRPDLFMGYNLMPGGCTALVIGSMFGRPAAYQMTGGPVEIVGGGIGKNGPLTRWLSRPSRMIERLAVAVVSRFDLVVCRGRSARTFLRDRGLNGTVRAITGSVEQPNAAPLPDRDIDLIYVGRLAPVKQPERFIELVAEVSRRASPVRAVVVGDGELRDAVAARAQALGVADCIEFAGQRGDVGSLLARAKVFVLTSRSEGMSIAMAEAMTAGCVPVVANVGELGELVVDDQTGFLADPEDLSTHAARATAVLSSEDLRRRLSAAASSTAMAACGLAAVTERWRLALDELVPRSTRSPSPRQAGASCRGGGCVDGSQ